jgi:hypothetical protein
MMALPRRESADVLLCQRKIKSLEQENAMLKERLAGLRALEHQIDRLSALLKTSVGDLF